MPEPDADAVAHELLRQHRAGAPFAPFPQLATTADGYAVQRRFVDLLTATEGDPIGYKIGLTSPRMQAMCGVDRPVAGVILRSRVHEIGRTVARRAYGRLGVEFEIAVQVDDEGEPVRVAPAMELVDDRAAAYGALHAPSLIADNSWNAGIVLGPWRDAWPPLETVVGIAYRDDTELDRGSGSDVLGHPLAPLRWLREHLAAHGDRLRPGAIVLTGSIVPTTFPTAPVTYRWEIAGVGTATLAVS